MNSKFPGPCDDVKWGRTDLWDLFEAAHVLVDIEPSTDQDPYFEPEADALYKQLIMSIALGYPKVVQQIGNRHLFLPLQMIDWALQKGHVVSDELIVEVRATAKMSIDRLTWEKERRAGPFPANAAIQPVTPTVTAIFSPQDLVTTVNVAEQATYVPKQRLQEYAILNWLKDNNWHASSLPKAPPGKPGVKAAAWSALSEIKTTFGSRGVFDSAWERLRSDKLIKEAE